MSALKVKSGGFPRKIDGSWKVVHQRLCEDLEGARRRRGCEMQRSASIEKRYRTALMITAP